MSTPKRGQEQAAKVQPPERPGAPPPPPLPSGRIEVKAMAYHVPITREVVDDSSFLPPGVSLFEWMEEQQAKFDALPPEERRRLLAERAAAEAAAKAERTCPHCGCDPDEHGGY